MRRFITPKGHDIFLFFHFIFFLLAFKTGKLAAAQITYSQDFPSLVNFYAIKFTDLKEYKFGRRRPDDGKVRIIQANVSSRHAVIYLYEYVIYIHIYLSRCLCIDSPHRNDYTQFGANLFWRKFVRNRKTRSVIRSTSVSCIFRLLSLSHDKYNIFHPFRGDEQKNINNFNSIRSIGKTQVLMEDNGMMM